MLKINQARPGQRKGFSMLGKKNLKPGFRKIGPLKSKLFLKTFEEVVRPQGELGIKIWRRAVMHVGVVL